MRNQISIIKNFLQSRPPKVVWGKLVEKITNKKISHLDIVREEVDQKRGLEIGGPSGIFEAGGYCPVYDSAHVMDCVNFSNNTVWEGEIKNGFHFNYAQGKTGYQWIAEATTLEQVENNHYDFLISSNCLEHIANPLKAIKEWLRVIKQGGCLLLVLPKKESNFDHKRPVTAFEHLLEDYNHNTGEEDHTHLAEILALHDLRRDPLAGSFENFKKRSEDSFINRCLHHHVFDLALLKQIADHFKMDVLFTESSVTDHFIMARKV